MINTEVGLSRGAVLLIAAIAVVGALGVLGVMMVSVDVPRIPHVMNHQFPSGLQAVNGAAESALEAPLFWESRLPVAVAEVEPESTVDTLEGVELVGIVDKTALLKKADQIKRVRLGAKFDGFMLKSIKGNKILLVSADRKIELKIFKEPPSSVVLKPLN